MAQPPPRTGPPVVVKTSQLPVVLMLVGLALVIGFVSVIGAIVAGVSSRSTPTPRAQSRPARVRAPRMRQTLKDPACPLGDVTGDGVRDYVGLFDEAPLGENRPLRVVRFNGSDGTVLTPPGTGTTYPNDGYHDPFCAAEGWFGVAVEATTTIELFHGDMLQPRHRVDLHSEPSRIARGDGCIRIGTNDGRQHGIALESGELMECATPTRPIPFLFGMSGYARSRAGERARASRLCQGARCYRVDRMAGGYMEVQATDSDVARWTVPLRFHSVQEDAFFFTLTPSVVVVLGQRGQAHGGGMFAVGLDAESGRERWVAEVPWNRPSLVEFNGRYVVLGIGNYLLALDPLTGNRVWRIGH